MNLKRIAPPVVLLGVGVYLLLFYGLTATLDTGAASIRRVDLLWVYLLLPEELIGAWFGSPPSFALFDRLGILAVATGMLAWSFCTGWLLLLLLRVEKIMTPLETFVFSTAVGLNVLSTYVLLVGLLGLSRSFGALALPAILAPAVALWLFVRRENGRQEPLSAKLFGKGAKKKQSSRGSVRREKVSNRKEVSDLEKVPGLFSFLAIPFVLAIVLGGVLPPIEFDVREYHLQAPKEFYQQGRIDFLPHNLYANMALGAEMHALAGMTLTGDWWTGALVGKTVIAAMSLLCALGLLAAGRRFFSPTAGVVAAVVFVSTPWTVRLSTIGFVEGASGLYLLLAFYAVLLWRESPGRRLGLLGLAGYLAGSAAACKYPGVLFVVLPLLAWIVADQRFRFGQAAQGSWPSVFRGGGVFLAAAAVGCGLWLGKNWVLSGNPTYPLLYDWFGGLTWTPEKDAIWNEIHGPRNFRAATFPTDLARVGLRSLWLSPLLVPLAALAFLRAEGRRLSLMILGYFGFIVVAWWLLTLRTDRFWIHGLPLVALLAGAGACWTNERWWRRTLVGLMVFGAVANLLVATSEFSGYNRYFVPLAQLRGDPQRVDSWHAYLNQEAAEGRVLLIGEAQVFDLEMPILYNTWLDDSVFAKFVRDAESGELRPPEEIRAALEAEGISHVYVHWGELARYRDTGYEAPELFEFFTPDLFERLVAQGVLRPIPTTGQLAEHPGRGYWVADEP